jgi:hypothetical protein
MSIKYEKKLWGRGQIKLCTYFVHTPVLDFILIDGLKILIVIENIGSNPEKNAIIYIWSIFFYPI